MHPSSEPLARRIVQQLRSAGHTAYWAGGCVRDQLMHLTPKDYDIATSATPDQVLALFPRSQKIGAAFGVVLIKQNHAHAEVATFRTDGHYSDGRHPDSVHFASAPEDAQRRDFTCNGLFFDPLTNQILDYVHGQADIQQKLLRAIGDPEKRFTEDHLRMLRAIRFAARLNFTIEPNTHAAIQRMQNKITTISRERIGEEIRMMLEHPTRAQAGLLLASFAPLFTEVFGLPNPPTDFPMLAQLPPATSRTLALAALLCDTFGELNAWPESTIPTLRAKLILSNDETESLTFLSRSLPHIGRWEDLTKAATKRLIADPRWPLLETLFCIDPDHAPEVLAFRERIAELQEENPAPTPFITGENLIALGARPGKLFKAWLEQLYDRQLEGELTSQEEAEQAARDLLSKASQ